MIKIIGPALVVAALALMPSVAGAAAAPGVQLKQDAASGVTQVQGGNVCAARKFAGAASIAASAPAGVTTALRVAGGSMIVVRAIGAHAVA